MIAIRLLKVGFIYSEINCLPTLQLITYNFEYAVKSTDRPKPTAVFHIDRSRQ